MQGVEVIMTRWGDKPVYLCCGHTDMRKSINAVYYIVNLFFDYFYLTGVGYGDFLKLAVTDNNRVKIPRGNPRAKLFSVVRLKILFCGN